MFSNEIILDKFIYYSTLGGITFFEVDFIGELPVPKLSIKRSKISKM